MTVAFVYETYEYQLIQKISFQTVNSNFMLYFAQQV